MRENFEITGTRSNEDSFEGAGCDGGICTTSINVSIQTINCLAPLCFADSFEGAGCDGGTA
jgi:hypothetical protein